MLQMPYRVIVSGGLYQLALHLLQISDFKGFAITRRPITFMDIVLLSFVLYKKGNSEKSKCK